MKKKEEKKTRNWTMETWEQLTKMTGKKRLNHFGFWLRLVFSLTWFQMQSREQHCYENFSSIFSSNYVNAHTQINPFQLEKTFLRRFGFEKNPLWFDIYYRLYFRFVIQFVNTWFMINNSNGAAEQYVYFQF